VNWEKVSLGELCDVKGGAPAPQNDDAFYDGEIPFVRMKDLGRYHLTNNLDKVDQKLSRKEFDSKRYELIPKGSILMPRSGSVALNHRAILGIDAIVVSHICALIIKSKRIDNRFLYYFLTQTDMRKFTKKTTGLDSINFSDIRKIQILLPPLPEQKRIAEVLDKADALRKKRRLALQKLDTLLQSVFLEMFGDPVKNPKGFETIFLENGITLKGGFAFKSGNYVSKGIPLIRIGEANRGKVDSNNAKFLPRDFLQSHSKFVLQPGDLLMSLTGTTGKDDYANVAILGNEYEHYFLNQRVAQFLMKDGVFTKEYVYQLLKDSQIKAQITGKSRGIRQANISNNDILKLRVTKPPIESQEKFTAVFYQVKTLIKKYILEESYLENLFQSLQQRAFKGELFSNESLTVKPQEEKSWRQTSLS
jgi:type I restriction enzyme S subunit